ncbi:MarR family winged helix-turn-helix transcriptional regulator [Asanoa sp. WMMD1127]|uniref:MarR family winged helix-turn-helix transcriptional regulator n=1 Tax=Asanoa sp. WMMD1127 TaxID=3016107 RepID=UPI002416A97E|nr:MarR family winged helix-turn-helix transcriptional regulator [Asanoa sp. WMMD1127]MDG4822838.1 MarR family winged helix-turn-helix transcriptional regulator [Asanoa sp. WMMD1127]
MATNGTRTRPKALSAREQRAWDRYRRMQGLLASQLNRQLMQETGLSDADYGILSALLKAPEHRLRGLALRCEVQWEKSRLSHHLGRMQARGLVAREDCVEDSRGAVFRLTEAGRAAVEGAADDRVAAVRTYLLDLLTPDQLDALAEISDAVLARLADDDAHRRAVAELARGA